MACKSCSVELTPTDIALSKKLFGRQITEYFCIECIAEFYETTTDELRLKIEGYKRQGCTLFG